MKYDMALVQRGGDWWLRVPGKGRARRVCSVSQACAKLGRSRRQAYRMVVSGAVPSLGKAFGELLLDAAAVERVAGAPSCPQPVPKRLAPFFPEYDLSALNVGRDRSLIVARVLDRCTAAEARWLFRRLSRREIARVVREDGARLMSARSLRLWSLCLAIKPKPLPQWRRVVSHGRSQETSLA